MELGLLDDINMIFFRLYTLLASILPRIVKGGSKIAPSKWCMVGWILPYWKEKGSGNGDEHKGKKKVLFVTRISLRIFQQKTNRVLR